jgi:hypothetical protein
VRDQRVGDPKFGMRVNPFDISAKQVFSLMQPTSNPATNRYAVAYIQPEYEQLRNFNTNRATSTGLALDRPISSATHWPGRIDTPQWRELGGAYGSIAARSELYWIAYVAIGYQGDKTLDRDPDNERNGENLGALTIGPLGSSTIGATIVFAETLREAVAEINNRAIDFTQVLSRTTVHEVGHQFGLSKPVKDIVDGSGHRKDRTLMNIQPLAFTDSEFIFHPQDIFTLRQTYKKV